MFDDLLVAGSAALGICIPVYVVALSLMADAIGPGDPAATRLHFFPRNLIDLRPEPAEQLGYTLALTFPLVAAALSLGLARLHHRDEQSRRVVRLLALVGQGLLAVLLLLSFYKQFLIQTYSAAMTAGATVAAVAAVAALVRPPVAAIDGRGFQVRAAGLLTPAGVAVALIAAIGSVYSDSTVGHASPETWGHLPFTSEEFAAAVNGATPLVDFTSQYANVAPLILAPWFSLVGGVSTLTFTATMAALSVAALLCVLASLRLVAGPHRRAWAATLFLMFVLVTVFPTFRHDGRLHDALTYPAVMPIRYGIPLLLSSLTAWAALRPSRSRDLLISAVAAAALINNLDFGVPAFGAAWFAAVLRGRLQPQRSWRGVWQFPVALGILAVAYGLTALARAGDSPSAGSLLYYPRQFAQSGFFMLPLPGTFGLHLVMFLTTCLVLIFALVRVAVQHRKPDRTGLEVARSTTAVYAATFALGAGTYYLGRSDINVLPALFCAWALALTTSLAGAPGPSAWLRLEPRTRLLVAPTAAALCAFPGFALGAVVPDAAYLPQIGRLDRPAATHPMSHPAMAALLSRCTERGDDVLIAFPRGYAMASEAGVRNWFPFADPTAVVTDEQVDTIVSALGRRGQPPIFTSTRYAPHGLPERLTEEGYSVVTARGSLQVWASREPAATSHGPDAAALRSTGCR